MVFELDASVHINTYFSGWPSFLWLHRRGLPVCVSLSFILPWGRVFLALCMGHLHAEPLQCFLHAVYFSIYSSIVLLRQCPTFSGCFFHSIAFYSNNTSLFTAFIWNILERSCCVWIDKNAIWLWCEGEMAWMLVKKFIVQLSESARFNHCSEHCFAYFSHPRSYLQSKHLRLSREHFGSTMEHDKPPPCEEHSECLFMHVLD